MSYGRNSLLARQLARIVAKIQALFFPISVVTRE